MLEMPCNLHYTQNFLNRLLWDASWTVAGRILQLSPQQESFQLAFEKLSMVAFWIKIFHLSMELWGGDILEMVASQFGRVLKVDEHTLDYFRAKFARVCVEDDLSQPRQLSTWVNYGDHFVFVLVLYEKLPVFCCSCVESTMVKLTAHSPAIICNWSNLCPQNWWFKGQ
ncbi:uncharacterized protein LOC120265977 isoform X2 [Dioscorea cayenensis subsp. rotundata]|uniref:Uncharacterized protein LOC120265977 isoform X2 n=1 Tax=Dioscorea cayennensis subsp. rotundata TaxID=55577 RepID=A0AB40BUD2_DIOCR|nr:uncharacterized protein LOC120265977 isoform X2 [Dioscorea cayenensis subsp. rotundata]